MDRTIEVMEQAITEIKRLRQENKTMNEKVHLVEGLIDMFYCSSRGSSMAMKEDEVSMLAMEIGRIKKEVLEKNATKE